MPLLIQGISRAIAFHEVARLSTSRPFDVVLCTTQKYPVAQEKRQLTVFQSYFFFQSLLISLPKTGTHLPSPSVGGKGGGQVGTVWRLAGPLWGGAGGDGGEGRLSVRSVGGPGAVGLARMGGSSQTQGWPEAMGLGHTVFSQQTLRIHSCRRLSFESASPCPSNSRWASSPTVAQTSPSAWSAGGFRGALPHTWVWSWIFF